jgi:cytochrome c556
MHSKFLILISIILFTTSSLLSAHDASEKLETRKTILNAIHSDDVKKIMRQLNTLVYEREYTELELQKLSNKQIELLAKEANALAQTAENLPNIASLKKLSEEDQLAFNAMANQLQEATQELKREVEANHQKKIDAAYKNLEKTCNTCHQLFRSW